jgi:hypothetical protein
LRLAGRNAASVRVRDAVSGATVGEPLEAHRGNVGARTFGTLAESILSVSGKTRCMNVV